MHALLHPHYILFYKSRYLFDISAVILKSGTFQWRLHQLWLFNVG